MKTIRFSIITALLSIISFAGSAQLYSTKEGRIDFYSQTPVENIEAHTSKTLAVLNASTKELAFSVPNISFEFQNKLMQEHFNEKYMESEKYPSSSFKGKINEAVELTKEGTYPVTVTGKLNVHGVELSRTINGNLVVKGNTVQLISDFKIRVADHKIEVPTLVTAKIAEEISVHVDTVLKPKQ
jgi:polyisoprenoid-binding protein YceI